MTFTVRGVVVLACAVCVASSATPPGGAAEWPPIDAAELVMSSPRGDPRADLEYPAVDVRLVDESPAGALALREL